MVDYGDDGIDRRAHFVIGRETLERMFDLPEGVRIVAIETSMDPVSVRVHVRGSHLAVVPPDQQSPRLDGQVGASSVFVRGKAYSRWNWTPPEEIDF